MFHASTASRAQIAPACQQGGSGRDGPGRDGVGWDGMEWGGMEERGGRAPAAPLPNPQVDHGGEGGPGARAGMGIGTGTGTGVGAGARPRRPSPSAQEVAAQGAALGGCAGTERSGLGWVCGTEVCTEQRCVGRRCVCGSEVCAERRCVRNGGGCAGVPPARGCGDAAFGAGHVQPGSPRRQLWGENPTAGAPARAAMGMQVLGRPLDMLEQNEGSKHVITKCRSPGTICC